MPFFLSAFLLFFGSVCTCFGMNTYAVVVGISDYKSFGSSTGDLKFAAQDAAFFYDYLIRPDGGNVPSRNVILLTNQNADLDHILKALTLFTRAEADDQIIFFFSGHGNSGVFLPYESDGSNYFLAHSDVKQAFRQSRALHKICFADACLSGTIQIREFPDSQSNMSGNNSDVIVFLSSLASQYSVEYKALQQGVFTFYLLKALMGGADINKDRNISAYELYRFVSLKVRNYSKLNSLDQVEQKPVMYGKFPRDAVIAKLPRLK